MFLTTFQVLPCEFLIFHVFQLSRHIPGPTMCVPHFPCFSVFSAKSRSYSVYFSFSTFLSISCHIPGQTVFVAHFPPFQFSHHNPGPTVCISHYSLFSVFLAIFQGLECISHFHVFNVSCHIPGLTVCVFHFL